MSGRRRPVGSGCCSVASPGGEGRVGRRGGVCRAAAEAIGAVSAAEPRRAEGPRQRRPEEPLGVTGAQRLTGPQGDGVRPAVSVRAGPLPWRLGGLCGKEGPGPRFHQDEGRQRGAAATSEAAKVSRFGDERRAGTSARRALSSENRVAFASRQPAQPPPSRQPRGKGPLGGQVRCSPGPRASAWAESSKRPAPRRGDRRLRSFFVERRRALVRNSIRRV